MKSTKEPIKFTVVHLSFEDFKKVTGNDYSKLLYIKSLNDADMIDLISVLSDKELLVKSYSGKHYIKHPNNISFAVSVACKQDVVQNCKFKEQLTLFKDDGERKE